MSKVNKITKITDCPFVNLYVTEGTNKKGKEKKYYVASRARTAESMKMYTGDFSPDAVVIYCLYGDRHDKVVLVRQYRYSIDGYTYELPAGLVDEGETLHEAAVREMKEETGLDFVPLPAGSELEGNGFTTIGLSDESCGTVFGYAYGEVSGKYLESDEEIEVVIADREEVRRIMREEHMALICRYQMMHFIADEDPFAFVRKNGG